MFYELKSARKLVNQGRGRLIVKALTKKTISSTTRSYKDFSCDELLQSKECKKA